MLWKSMSHCLQMAPQSQETKCIYCQREVTNFSMCPLRLTIFREFLSKGGEAHMVYPGSHYTGQLLIHRCNHHITKGKLLLLCDKRAMECVCPYSYSSPMLLLNSVNCEFCEGKNILIQKCQTTTCIPCLKLKKKETSTNLVIFSFLSKGKHTSVTILVS